MVLTPLKVEVDNLLDVVVKPYASVQELMSSCTLRPTICSQDGMPSSSLLAGKPAPVQYASAVYAEGSFGLQVVKGPLGPVESLQPGPYTSYCMMVCKLLLGVCKR